MKKITLFVLAALAMPSTLLAEALTPGNLLVSTENVIYETTLDGQIVQSIPTMYPYGEYPATERARDIVVDRNGVIHLFNGTFSPYMSSYDPVTEVWRHETHYDFSIANNDSFGGIDVYQNQVFVTDYLNQPSVISFNTEQGGSARFANGTAGIDLTIGLDGLLYVLSPGGSPEGRTVDVYNPYTYGFVTSIDLTAIFGWTGHRAVAADQYGSLYIADLDGEIHHVFSPSPIAGGGYQLNQTISPTCYRSDGSESRCTFTDINISPSGQLALGGRLGDVLITDINFSSTSHFNIGNRVTFVAFVPGPLEIDLDVQPGRFPNKVSLGRKHLWVSIPTNEFIDARRIDPATVRLGVSSASTNRSPRLVDGNADGQLDLRLRFRIRELGVVCGDTDLSMTASTYDGQEIVATDSIVTIGCD